MYVLCTFTLITHIGGMQQVRFCTFVPYQMLLVIFSSRCHPTLCKAPHPEGTRGYLGCKALASGSSLLFNFVVLAFIIYITERHSRRQFWSTSHAT